MEHSSIEYTSATVKTPVSPLKRFLIGATLVVIAAVIGGVSYGIQQYNEILKKDEIVEAQWSHVLNQYMRRADLIPNLVNVVKSYASHETKLFEAIAKARSKIASLSKNVEENSRNQEAIDEFQKAQNELAVPLARLLMITEAYPQLKADDLYRDLMVQLEGTENRIAYSRQLYIESIAAYNFDIRKFPNNLIANAAGYSPRPRFTVANQAVLSKSAPVDLK